MNLDEIIEKALAEDIGSGDHTSLACIPQGKTGKAYIIAKEAGIIAGLNVASQVFQKVDSTLKVTLILKDGMNVKKGDKVLLLEGRCISILTGERLALNFMQHLSGIATYTNIIVNCLNGLKTRILDTRKTTPNLRFLQKEAVKAGGGINHRFGLYDMIMIKDNHIDFSGGIVPAIQNVQKYLTYNNLNLKIEIEVRNLDELQQVLDYGGVDRIMLDNFAVEEMRKAVKIIAGRYETEASGGITLDTVREYAETGVDYISIGALTHHIQSLDLSLKAEF